MKSQSDINSSSFEEVETRPLLLSGGRSGDVTAAGKQEFPPQHFPSLQHLSPIFISNSPPPHALLLTHSPHSLLYFYLKLFPQISGGSQNSQPYQGRYLLWGEHITMLFHCWRKIQHRTQILRFIEKCSFLFSLQKE